MTGQARAPADLQAPGRRLWRQVVTPYVLTPAELLILEQACRTADELMIIEKAVRDLDDLVVVGSMMQPKAHPLLEEVRRHRVMLDKLTRSLNLPDAGVVVRPDARSGPRTLRKAGNGGAPRAAG